MEARLQRIDYMASGGRVRVRRFNVILPPPKAIPIELVVHVAEQASAVANATRSHGIISTPFRLRIIPRRPVRRIARA
jgi:hypothetical protein